MTQRRHVLGRQRTAFAPAALGALAFALAMALSVGAAVPTVVRAIPPSPHLLALAKKSPALARRINAHQARSRASGIDGFAVKTYGPHGHLVPAAGVSGPAYSIARTSPVARVLAAAAANATAAAGSGAALTPAPTVFRQLVLLVDFSDHPASEPPAFYDDIMFRNVTGPSSVRGYYREVSADKLDMQGVDGDLPSQVGWLHMPHPYSYYVGTGEDNGTGTYPNNAQRLFEDAAAAANAAGVDFSRYDNDGDGYIDGVVMIHAGRGAEFTGKSTDIWSHQWTAQNETSYDGKKLGVYTTEPEYWESVGDMTTGVISHELGHSFGLPDLYDTDYSSEGLGAWSLMAGGSWNGPDSMGSSPARFDAWCLTQLGFADAVPVTGTIVPETLAGATTSSEGTILRIAKHGASSASEYFLVENRRKANTDTYLPGEGLLVLHVDDGVGGDNPNDNELHPRVAVEEAHGGTQNLRSTSSANHGDSGDTFPGRSNKRAFDDTTNPSSGFYTGASGIRIAWIGDNLPTMNAIVTPDVATSQSDTTPPVTESDALGAYDGTATIALTAADPGGLGVAATYWRLDGAAAVSGETVVVPTSGAHTLQYWSVDLANNTEATHVAYFKVKDIEPPVASCDASGPYTSYATVSVSATDTPNGSGISSVGYRVDDGATHTVIGTSTSFFVDGDGDHTVAFWATDIAGNISHPETATFTITPGTVVRVSTKPVITVSAGAPFSVRGQVDASTTAVPPLGQYVHIERLSGSQWVTAGPVDAPLTANGAYTFTGVTAWRNSTLRVTTRPGSALVLGFSRPLLVNVTAVLSRPSLSRAVPHPNRWFTVSGRVSPKHASTVVVRWYKVSHSGKRTLFGSPKTVALAASGRWSLRKHLHTGRWAVKATHADGDHVSHSSAYRTFSVR